MNIKNEIAKILKNVGMTKYSLLLDILKELIHIRVLMHNHINVENDE